MALCDLFAWSLTHRNGMSQYGARARAEQGQSAEYILKAYYPNDTERTMPCPQSM
jgi:peptidoglycan hydrolase-like amidase